MNRRKNVNRSLLCGCLSARFFQLPISSLSRPRGVSRSTPHRQIDRYGNSGLCQASRVSISSTWLVSTAKARHQQASGLTEYKILKQLGNGEFVEVDSLEDLNQAVKLLRELKATWPGTYLVRDSEGNDIKFPE